VAGVKDKPSGEDGAAVADQADRADAALGEGEGADERRRAEPVAQETLPDGAVEGALQAGSADELALQVAGVEPSDLTLPAPGLPDDPTYTGDPVAYVAEAPDGEPAVEAALAWQPEIEPDPEEQPDPEFIAATDADPAQPMQAEAAIETIALAPGAEPTHEVAPVTHAPGELPADEPPAEPTAIEQFVADEPALAEQLSTEPISAEEEPAVPIAETRGEAPWPEQPTAELPTTDEPISDEPDAFTPVQVAPLTEQVEAEPTSVEGEEPPAQAQTLPDAESPVQTPWPEHAATELSKPDEPVTEAPAHHADEQPLRDRIPSVLPVELEAFKAPLAVPVFEPPPRPPEATQATFTAPSRTPQVALAAASGAGDATAIPRRADAIDEAAPSQPLVRDITPFLHRGLRLGALTLGALACLVLVLIVLYRWVNPPTSTLMLGQWLTGTRIDQRWVPLNRISPYLQRAVITSEDGRFCQHRGVDWGEIEEAIERARDGIPRGGSTISMQVVKNLFLWPSKSYVRKALEFPLTFAIELAWSKPRILEIYLNIAEWGPGVFGAEAAARYHFGKSAATLTSSQAALLAVSLPNPIERRAGAPGPGMQRLAGTIHARMLASPSNAACVQARR
jgi:monofunctional biosynthetic peptidoglycan transglycosylase